MYWGWRAQPDGTHLATEWLTAFFVPVVPRRRAHLRLGGGSRRQVSAIVTPHILHPVAVRYFDYNLIERLSLSTLDVARTYLATYVLGPLLLAWPLIAMALAARWLPKGWDQQAWFAYALFGVLVLGVGNVVAVVAVALRRAHVFS
jgi:hypothetical protein